MQNRLHVINCRTVSLSPAEAEVWFTAVAEQVTPTTEIRGALVGPRCQFTTTVEVAYPLRPIPRKPEGLPALTMHVVIPEPCRWDTQSPFLYRARVELWQDGQLSDLAGFDLGLRSLDLANRRIYWNGRHLTLRGTTKLPTSQEEAIRLRQAGYNLLLATPDNPLIWFTAYKVGLLVLGRLPLTERAVQQSFLENTQVSSFGWLLAHELLEGKQEVTDWFTEVRRRGYLLGIELDQAPGKPLPAGLAFFVCSEASVGALASVNLPKLVMREPGSEARATPGWATMADILGWIEQ